MATGDKAAQLARARAVERKAFLGLDLNSPAHFGLLLIIPIELFIWIIAIFPLLMEIYLSLTGWIAQHGAEWWDPTRWFWLENYRRVLFEDNVFRESIGRTVVFSTASLFFEFALGLTFALVYARGFPGHKVLTSFMIIPMMLIPAVTGMNFFIMFRVDGPVNAFLSLVSGQQVAIKWVADAALAPWAVIITDIWQWTPLLFLIFLSGLVALPQDQMNAATILGASAWFKFTRLTLPMMRPIIIIALIIRGMELFKTFDFIYVMTGGGPGEATKLISHYLYRLAFKDLRYSYAAAAAMVVLIFLIIVTFYAIKPLTPKEERA